MSLVDDIGVWLEMKGLGTVGEDIFKSKLPDSPDALIAVFAKPGVSAKPMPTLERPRVQVWVRDIDYATAEAKAAEVFEALHVVANTTINGVRYLLIQAATGQAGIAPMGADSNGRNEMSLMFDVIKER